MKVGLIGFQAAGKTTLFQAVAAGAGKGSIAAVRVPDPRFDRIVAQVRPKKATPATVTVTDDLDDAQGGTGRLFTQRFLDEARKLDLLLHVVRAFESDTAPYHAEVDPQRDISTVEDELVLTDLQIVENRLERLKKSPNARTPGTPDYLDRVFFERIRGELESGRPIRALELSDEEAAIARNYQFLSAKPMVVAVNVGEKEAGSPGAKVRAIIDRLGELGTQAFAVSAEVEMEISQLDAEAQREFLADYGLEEPASARLVRAVYDALGLITFFTAGENETRAWALRRGSTALKAADTIHSDIARGFIRAEVVSYADWEAAGSWEAAVAQGRMRLEGKEYVVQDGDLLHIRNKS
ncbi:MAG: YchF family ATPase [Fimbriimonadales bacterium]|nr:YchF family ATPase [Fimbriimonadales bacterium]